MSRLSLKKTHTLILFLIIMFAFGIRVFHLSQVPPGLNRDEASIGYTAYSLLRTSADEYSRIFPISFQSFGDWKLPLYIYVAIPFTALFGLTEFAVRFPSALFGTVTVICVYFLIRELFKENKYSLIIALIGSLFLAISPWHIFMSRNASESNIAVFLTTCGFLLFFKSFRKHILLIFSFIAFSATLYTYHGYHVFTPLLFIALIAIYHKTLRTNRYFLIALSLFLFLSGIIFAKTVLGADKTKISGLFPLADISVVHENIVLHRNLYGSSWIGRVLYNKGTFLLEHVVRSYVRGFSPEFLFITGGANKQHTIPDFGNLYLWNALTIPLGIFFLAKNKEKHHLILFVWLFLAPIAASITQDAPHTNRMMSFLPLPAILSAYGLGMLVAHYKKNVRILFYGLCSVVIFLSVISFLDRYFVQFPYQWAEHWGYVYRQLFQMLEPYRNNQKYIIMSGEDRSPYIYDAFYNQVDPHKLQQETVRYDPTDEGFYHVKEFNGIMYEKIDWETAIFRPNIVYVTFANGFPSEVTKSAAVADESLRRELENTGHNTTGILIGIPVETKIKDTVYLPNGDPYFYIVQTQLAEK